MQKVLINIVGIIFSVMVCVAIFNANDVNAAGPVYQLDDVIGYVGETDEPVTFGEYTAWLEEDNPDLVKYCKQKAYTAMAIFNERETKTAETLIEEVEVVKERRGIADHVEFVRMINDITRKNNKTDDWKLASSEENIEKYANGELHACLLQGY